MFGGDGRGCVMPESIADPAVADLIKAAEPEIEPDDADVIEPASTGEPMPDYTPDDTDPNPDEGPVPDQEA